MRRQRSTQGRWRKLAILVALAAGALILAGPASQAGGRPRPVRVMTRNLYLGAELTPAAASQTPLELALAATSIWQNVQATDFPARARLLAAEIGDADPTLIGLQEVALWRTGLPDGPPQFGGTPAGDVAYDFLDLLRQELEARNLHYGVVIVQLEADMEAPTILGYDVRMTQRDVILAKEGLPAGELRLSNAQAGHFLYNLSFPVAGGLGSVTSTRGWTSVDVVANRRAFRFVNAHLEAYSNFYRTAQAFELLSGPLATGTKVVLVGDLNSAPDDPVFDEAGSPFNMTNPYDVLTGYGFTDTWMVVNPLAAGYSCCQDQDLMNAASVLYARYDHVLTRSGIATYRSALVGDDPSVRTPQGLWSSDHAGVIASVAP